MAIKRLIFIVFTLLMAMNATAAPIALTEATSARTLALDYFWMEDAAQNVTPGEALRLDKAGKFISAKTQQVPLEYSASHVWLRLDIANLTAADNLYLDSLLHLIFIDGIYKLTNENELIAQRKMTAKNYAAFELDLLPGETARFYVNFSSVEPLSPFFTIKTREALAQRDMRELPLYGAILGIFFVVIAYNLFLFISLGHKHHFFYVLFAATNALISMFSINLPKGMTELVDLELWSPYIRFLAPLTTILFSQVFLTTKEKHPRLHKALNIYLLVYAVAGLVCLALSDSYLFSTFSDPIMLIGMLLLVMTGIQSWRQGNPTAKFYLLAMGSFFIGIFVMLCFQIFLLPTNPITPYAFLLGQAGEMVLMSLALASQIKVLEEQKVRAEATAMIKSKLLRVMSHDIMNPLTLIKGYSQILARKGNEGELLEKIIRSTRIIERILKFVVHYENNRGSSPLKLEPVSVSSLFDELTFLFEGQCMEKGIRLEFEADDNDICVWAEPVSLTSEVFANLLSNAIKFSFVGSIVRVKAHVYRDTVIITVRDSGIGIPSETQSELLKPSSSKSRLGTNGEMGTGFGMLIASSFVREQEGDIKIHSVSYDEDPQNCGTEVQVTLKRADKESGFVPKRKRPPLLKVSKSLTADTEATR